MVLYGAHENPIGMGAFENPLSGGELALAFVTGGVGYALTDVLDRYLATSDKTDAATNAIVINSAPSLMRMAAQAGLAAAPFAGAYFVHQPMARAALQGFGLGAGFHLVGQVLKTFVFGKLLKKEDDPKAIGHRLYPDLPAESVQEAAAKAQEAANKAAAGTVAGPPQVGVGAPHGLGAYVRSGGYMLPAGRVYQGFPGVNATNGGGGAAVASTTVTNGGGGAAVATTSNGGGGGAPVYSTAPLAPVYQSVGPVPGCSPCSAETSMAAMQSSYAAAREEVGCNGCGPGVGTPPNGFRTKVGSAFPD